MRSEKNAERNQGGRSLADGATLAALELDTSEFCADLERE
jgi:hypothetical protein